MLTDTRPPVAANTPTTDVHDLDADLDDLTVPAWQLPDQFRHGIGHLTRGVAVLTTIDEHGERYGVTTTGVSVLSVDPPTLVVCMRRRSKFGTQLPRTRQFCVNVLAGHQRTIAEAFAGRRGLPADRFHHGRWTTGPGGTPILAEALACFECEVDLLYGYPNHMIVLGSVRNVVHTAPPHDPLIYTSGQLSSLTPHTATATPA